MLSRPIAQPKPKADKHRRTRTHLKRMQAFKDAVWEAHSWRLGDEQYALCAMCSHCVRRRGWPLGVVDHVLPRSTAPQVKYDPANGQILCHDTCHPRKHGIRPGGEE